MASRTSSALPLVTTGFGLGGFVDGIVFHQVLQWHHLVAAYQPAGDLAGLRNNTFWDGVFHLACWFVVVAGVLWLLRRGDRPVPRRRDVIGCLLLGWGAFNIVDQVVFHMLLQAHHIRMVDNYLVYDLVYTALGAALIVAGLLLVREPRRRQVG